MVQRVIMGALGSGAYGLKVSKPTVDVATGAASDMLFNSTAGVTRVLLKGTITIADGSASGTVNFTALSSKPIVDLRRLADPGEEFPYETPYTINGYSQNIYPWSLAVTTSSFTLSQSNANHGGYTFAYIIYASAL